MFAKPSPAIMNVSGKTIAHKNNIVKLNSIIQLEIPGLSAGMYLLKLYNGENAQVFKVMKNKNY